MLAWTIYISFFGAAALMLLPAENRRRRGSRRCSRLWPGWRLRRWGAAHMSAPESGVSVDRRGQRAVDSELGIRFHLAADGISLVLWCC
jgi:NADH-quinone oxidoreductase subunit M